MDSDIYTLLALLSVITLAWVLSLSRWVFPPAWVEVLADYEFLGSRTPRGHLFHGLHYLKLRYEFQGRTFEKKMAPVIYSRRTQEWQVIPQPHDHIAIPKLLIRVHPKRPMYIEYQKWLWWHHALPPAVLGLFWGGLLTELHKHGQLPW